MKTGLDQGTVCRRLWVAEMNKVARAVAPVGEEVFQFLMEKCRDEIETLTDLVGNEKIRKAHKARRGSAVSMVEKGEGLEIRWAHRWATEKSMRTYVKKHLLVQARSKLPAEIIRRGTWLVENGNEICASESWRGRSCDPPPSCAPGAVRPPPGSNVASSVESGAGGWSGRFSAGMNQSNAVGSGGSVDSARWCEPGRRHVLVQGVFFWGFIFLPCPLLLHPSQRRPLKLAVTPFFLMTTTTWRQPILSGRFVRTGRRLGASARSGYGRRLRFIT